MGEPVERVDYIRKVGDQWCVFSEAGERLGCHDTEEGAEKQLAAIEISKHRAAAKDAAVWVTRDEMAAVCGDCADKMDALHIRRVRLDAMPAHLMAGLCAKFGAPEGFRTKCMASGIPVDDKGAFCNWLKNECHGTWGASGGADVGRGDGAGREVLRFDTGRLGKAQPVAGGGVRVPVRMARTGVLTYTRADGTKVRELRPPEEVFDKASLASFAGAPVTDLHPRGMVTSDNWRHLAVGHVADDVKPEDRFVASELVIHDAEAIRAIEDGRRREVSAGYRARLRMESGVWNGEEYDAVQTRIRANHLAIGPANWGRSGSEVALRLDSRGDAVYTEPEETNVAKTIKIDGIEYEAGSEAAAQAMEKSIAKANADRDAAQGKVDAAAKEAEELKGKLDAAEKAADAETIRAAVSARIRLETEAAKVLGPDEKLDGKTDREVMEAVILKSDEKAELKDRSDDYVRGRFEAVVGAAPAKNDSLAAARRAAEGASTEDLTDEEAKRIDSDAARARSVKESNEAWKQPLAASVDRVVKTEN